MTLDPDRLDPELRTLAGWVACLADARPARQYAALFAGARLAVVVSEPHQEAGGHGRPDRRPPAGLADHWGH
ncbi:MAG: hypothetical protein ACRDQW_17845 [Haloechinothrix sp.]